MKYILFSFLIYFLSVQGYSQGELNIDSGHIAFQQRKFDRAISIYSDCTKSENPGIKYISYYQRAYCYYELKNFEKAENDLRMALKISNNEPFYNMVKGNSYWLYYLIRRKDGITRSSLRTLKKATEYIETSILYSTIGYAECTLGKYKSAIKNLNIAISIDSNNAWAYNNRGLVYLKLNEVDLARADVNKSIQMEEQNPYAFKNSALIYIALGDYSAACAELDNAEKIEINSRMSGNDLEELKLLKMKYCEK